MSIFRHIVFRFRPFEEFPDRGLVEKGHTEDTEDIKGASIKPEVMLNNSNKTISCNGRINLDSDRIFGYTPERLYVKMLPDSFKELLHLPSVFIMQCNISCADTKVVSKVSESPLVVHRVITDTPEQDRILFPGLQACKSYVQIVENVIRFFKKVLSLNNFILKLSSFSNYEVRSNKIDCKESCKIKISPVKDIVGIRLVRNFIHGIHVINSYLGNMKNGCNLSNYIIEDMHIDSTFGFSKTCPPKEVQTQVNSCRIKSIKSPINLKFSCDSFYLSDRYHFIGKFFKDLIIPIRVCFCKIAACYQRFTKPQMVRFRGMSNGYTYKLSKTLTARQLATHHNQKLIPATERLDVFVSFTDTHIYKYKDISIINNLFLK